MMHTQREEDALNAFLSMIDEELREAGIVDADMDLIAQAFTDASLDMGEQMYGLDL